MAAAGYRATVSTRAEGGVRFVDHLGRAGHRVVARGTPRTLRAAFAGCTDGGKLCRAWNSRQGAWCADAYSSARRSVVGGHGTAAVAIFLGIAIALAHRGWCKLAKRAGTPHATSVTTGLAGGVWLVWLYGPTFGLPIEFFAY